LIASLHRLLLDVLVQNEDSIIDESCVVLFLMYGSGVVLIPRVTYVHANGIAEKKGYQLDHYSWGHKS